MAIATSLLIRRRAEIAGLIEARAAELDQLRAGLVHLYAAIRIMCPEAELELIRPKKPSRKGCDWFGRGELARAVLDVLRGAMEPLEVNAIAPAVMEGKGLPADAVALQRVAGMLKGALYRRDGRMVEWVAVGQRRRGWQIVG
ncbi:MAG: hypothetical protein AB7I59_07195 [Geminicoccaceae bacterium]